MTTMLAWILECAGEDPGFFVHAPSENFDAEQRQGAGNWFIAELVKPDLDIGADYAVCSFLELDEGLESASGARLLEAAARFLESTPRLKEAFINLDCLGNRELVRRVAMRPTGYGLEHRTEFRGNLCGNDDAPLDFVAQHRDREIGEFSLDLDGRHNAVNAMGAIAVAHRIGVAVPVIAQALQSYRGLSRRPQVTRGGGVTLFKGDASRPSAVIQILDSAARAAQGRMVGIFEPPPTVKFDAWSGEYADALTRCSQVLVADTARSREGEGRDGWAQSFADDLRDRGVDEVQLATDGASLTERLLELVIQGDSLVFLGDPRFLTQADRVEAALAARAARTPGEEEQPKLDSPLSEGDE